MSIKIKDLYLKEDYLIKIYKDKNLLYQGIYADIPRELLNTESKSMFKYIQENLVIVSIEI